MQFFDDMSDLEIIQLCRGMYEQDGVEAFLYKNLKKKPRFYNSLYARGFSQKKIIESLNLETEFSEYKNKNKRWNWEEIVIIAKRVKEKEGFLPPAGWFQKNGHASLVQATYKLGHSWEELRDKLGDFESSIFVESRNGMRWRSHPEASFSNFLYARDVKHKRGERYSAEYEEFSNSKGYFDLHFLNNKNEWIDVEIWGDDPGGHGKEKYNDRRRKKERFNRENHNFLGIHYNDCFDEACLSQILVPFIGEIIAFKFDRPTDKVIPTTHWSNTDELLEYCRVFATSMLDGKFPTEEWLRKRGKWSDREGIAYNTLSIYIKTWFGGIRKLRDLLGQGHVSNRAWDKESAIKAYQDFYTKHKKTPSQMRQERERLNSKFSREIIGDAACIAAAVVKYAGGTAVVDDILGIEIDRTRKWTKEKIIEGYSAIISEFGITPNQLIYDHKTGKNIIPKNIYRQATQLVDVASRKFGGTTNILKILEFKSPSRKRKKRSKNN